MPPRCACQRAIAISGSCGLPKVVPPNANAESPPSTSASVVPSDVGDRLRLPPREQLHELLGGERRAALRLRGRDDRLLVDARRHRLGLDPGRAQQREPGGGGGGEDQAHAHTLPFWRSSAATAENSSDGRCTRVEPVTDEREIELDVLRIAHGGVAVAELRRPGGVRRGHAAGGAGARAHHRRQARPVLARGDGPRARAVAGPRAARLGAPPSLDRPLEHRAGGAEFGHIAPARQRALKAEVLRDALGRIGHLPEAEIAALAPEVAAVPGRADGTRSRTRVRLHVDRTGRVGPYAARSKRVVPVKDLPLAVESLERLLPERARGRELDLVATASDAFAAGPRDRRAAVVERVGDREFRLEALGFWQVHPAAPAGADRRRCARRSTRRCSTRTRTTSTSTAVSGCSPRRSPTAATCGSPRWSRTGAASAHAAANLADLPRARAVQARVDAFLEAERVARPGATVLLDPPRSGAGAEIVDAIVASRPAQVVYVACDPVALARDLGTFADRGWRAATLAAFDLFPNTHHLETVVRTRAGRPEPEGAPGSPRIGDRSAPIGAGRGALRLLPWIRLDPERGAGSVSMSRPTVPLMWFGWRWSMTMSRCGWGCLRRVCVRGTSSWRRGRTSLI